MDLESNNLLPGDPRLIDQIVYELKSQGIFDQFRKECIADVDTKPAYQNLRQRVEGNVTNFLSKQKWSEDLNKNQLREHLRKHISDSGWLERGVERIVDQVVNPKINTVFLPKVEEVYHTILGIKKPLQKEESQESANKDQPTNNVYLLPNDLEAISPESNKDIPLSITGEKLPDPIINNDVESQDSSSNTTKTEDEESPPFEPLDELSGSSSKFSSKNENFIDPQESGLASQDFTVEPKYITRPLIEPSQNTENGLISFTDGKESDQNNERKVQVRNDEEKNIKKGLKKSESDKDKKKEKKYEGSSQSKDRLSSKSAYSSSKTKDKKEVREKEGFKDKDISKSNKEETKAREKSHDKKYKDSTSITDKKIKSSSSKNSKSDFKESSRSSDRSKHKGSSSKDKESSKEKIKDDRERRDEKTRKESDKDKYKTTSSSSKIKEISKKHKDSLERHKEKESSSKESKSKSDVEHKDKKSNEHKSRHSSGKHKKSDKDKTSDYTKGSSKKDKDKKSKDDHYSSKEKRNERRSTDRDSNDGSGKMSKNGSFNDNNSHSNRINKNTSNNILFDNSFSGDSSGGASEHVEGYTGNEYVEEVEIFEHEIVEHEFVQNTEDSQGDLVIEHHHKEVAEEIKTQKVEIFSEPQQLPPIKFIKPKFASNMEEALRIIKIRKQLAELERQANCTLQNLSEKYATKDKEAETKLFTEKIGACDIKNDNQMVLENVDTPISTIKFIKPKFASNIQEAMRLIKIRKKLAKLEREHVRTVAEIRKRKENFIQNEVITVPCPDKTLLNTDPPSLECEPKFNIEISDEEPLLQSTDLSSERFAELEARLALEMANIDFSSYDIPSDEEEYQSIVISPQKANSETSGENKESQETSGANKKSQETHEANKECQETHGADKESQKTSETNKESQKSSEANIESQEFSSANKESKIIEESLNLIVKKSEKVIEVSTKKTSSEGHNKLSPKSSIKNKIIKANATLQSETLKKKNILNKKIKDHNKCKQKNKTKKDIEISNETDISARPTKKKLIIISCKSNLFNGFSNDKTITEVVSSLPDSVIQKSPLRGNEQNTAPINKEVTSYKMENSTLDIFKVGTIQTINKDLNKILFVKVCKVDNDEIKMEEINKSAEKIKQAVEASDSKIFIKTEENIEPLNIIQTKENINQSNSKNVESKADSENLYNTVNGHTIASDEVNGISDNGNTKSDLWQSDEIPCFYFTPTCEASERYLSLLNDYIKQLESRIALNSIGLENGTLKKKVGRKRKIETVFTKIRTDDISLGSVSKRYDSSDLYKPRPIISRSTNRRRSLAGPTSKN